MEELAKSLGLNFQVKDELAKLSWWKRGYTRSWNIISGIYQGKRIFIYDHQTHPFHPTGLRSWRLWLGVDFNGLFSGLADIPDLTIRRTVINGKFYPYGLSAKIIKNLIEGKKVSRFRILLTTRWPIVILSIFLLNLFVTYPLYLYLADDFISAPDIILLVMLVLACLILSFMLAVLENLHFKTEETSIPEI